LLTISGCNKDDETPGATDDGVNLGSGDTGILNYAYALEQLEAAFYTQVLLVGWGAQQGSDQELIRDIRDHEVAHREFFRAVLGDKAIPDLEVDFSTVNFNSRDSVLETARTFEDLGVQAYNGAGKLLTSAENLAIAGKIVSVEARHAAYIRNLILPGSFADTSVLDPILRQDVAKTPQQVLVAADPFIITHINAEALPTG
jgi:rubrerythrin